MTLNYSLTRPLHRLIHCFCIGLVRELLKRLSNAAGQTTAPSTSTAGPQETPNTAAVTPKSQPAPENGRSVQSISTTISLLSTLCRGSPTITHVRFTHLYSQEMYIQYWICLLIACFFSVAI